MSASVQVAPDFTTGVGPAEVQRRWPFLAECLALAVATALAGFLRLSSLDTVPPGFFHDEAINGLAGQEILHGHFFVFYSYDFQEGLFHWLVAGAQLLWGASVLAVRAPAALAGTLTVPALYLLAARLFDRRVAVCAAFGLAFSFWHLEMSRFGVRGSLLPLLLVVTVFFLWRGIAGGRRGDFALAGLFLGLTGYTYLASRAVPLLLACFLLWQAVYDRARLRSLLPSYGLTLLVAIVVFVPLGYTYISEPILFGGRSDAVSLLAKPNAARALVASTVRTLGMFLVAGDPNLRHNIDGRPVFDLLGTAFFLVGVGVAAKRWRQGPYAFCLLWLLVMLVPGVLSDDNPHFLRTLGSAPAAYALLGVGVVAVGRWLAAWLRPRWYAVGVALWFLVLGPSTYYSYFEDYARQPQVAQAFEVQFSESAKYLAKAPPGPAVLLFPDGDTTEYPHVFQYFSGRTITAVPWFDANTTLLLGPEALEMPTGTLFMVLGQNEKANDLVGAFPGIRRLPAPTGVGGVTLPTAYQTTAPVQPWQLTYSRRLGVVLGDELLLEGYSVIGGGSGETEVPWQLAVKPGEKLALRVIWRTLRPAAQPDLRLSFQLLDPRGRRLTGKDLTAFPSDKWRGGERLATWLELPVPADAPPGKYELQVGAYSYADQGRALAAVDELGQALGERAIVAGVKIAPEPEATKPSHEIGAELVDGPKLLGYDLRQDQTALNVTLFWQTTRPMAKDYTVFLHLIDAAGHPIAQHDGMPADGVFPTSYWGAGDIVRDEHTIALTNGMPAGRYVLRVGMYDASSGRRLADSSGADAITLQGVILPYAD